MQLSSKYLQMLKVHQKFIFVLHRSLHLYDNIDDQSALCVKSLQIGLFNDFQTLVSMGTKSNLLKWA